ncbi:hypothetical protein [Fundidesulfovibrio soli]|uniref:hypothetical protein n=1 Tax=Fundidesulfovibrio soli TaxID=2922716 RepID=UPI0023515382|nr:hypothetical protein [Fundidesulfovibrio soli]
MTERSTAHGPAGLALPVFWAVAMACAAKLDIWGAGFSSLGAPVVLSGALKLCVVAAGFVWVCALGAAFLETAGAGGDGSPDSGRLAASGICGLGLVSLANFTLGALGLYSAWMYGPALLAGSWLLRGQAAWVVRCLGAGLGAVFRRGGPRGADWTPALVLFFPVAAVLALYVLFAKGVYPDFGGDVFYYFKYLADCARSGSIFPAQYDQLVYFPTKFSGIHYLLSVVFDPSYAALGTVIYCLVLLVCLCDFVLACTGSALYALVAQSAFLAGAPLLVFTNNFSKANFPASASVACFAYLLWKHAARPGSREYRVALHVQAVAVSLATTIVVGFAVLYGFMAAVLAAFRRRPWRTALGAALVCLAAYGAVAAVNFHILGVADIGLMDKQVRYGVLPAASAYLPDSACVFFLNFFAGTFALAQGVSAYAGNLGQLLLQDIARQNAYSPWLWAVAALGLAAGAMIPRLRREAAPAWGAAALLLTQVGLCAVLTSRAIMAHSTFLFGMVFAAAIHAVGLHLAARTLSGERAGLKKALDAAAAALALGVALHGLPHNLADDVRERVEFLRGLKSYHTVYAGYYPELPACDKIVALAGREHKVLPLSPFSPCSPYTGEHVVDLVTSLFGRDGRPLALAAPDDAAEILLRHGVGRVIVDFDDQAAWYAFLSPFHPDVIAAYCSGAVSLGGRKYMLTFGRANASGGLDPAFLEQYRAFYDKAKSQPAHELHERILDNIVADRCVAKGR